MKRSICTLYVYLPVVNVALDTNLHVCHHIKYFTLSSIHGQLFHIAINCGPCTFDLISSLTQSY